MVNARWLIRKEKVYACNWVNVYFVQKLGISRIWCIVETFDDMQNRITVPYNMYYL